MFIARQPIFDRNMNVYGYELLFRSTIESTKFDMLSSLHATANVVSNTYEVGFDKIVGDKRAFINFDGDFLKYSIPDILNSEKLVVEILEGTSDDKETVNIINELKFKGYTIALDDFVESPKSYNLFSIADIIKVDILNTPFELITEIISACKASDKLLLAEKIETQEIFDQTMVMGFDLFQGYFFSKPQILKKSGSRHSSFSQYIRIFNELESEEPSYQVLAEIIERDLNLSYKVLRHIKNRHTENIENIFSIKKALTYIGLNDFKKWISILMIQQLSEEKSPEILRISLMRSYFAEQIAIHSIWHKNQYEALMMGLLSVLDAVLDIPIEEALKELPLVSSIKDALIDRKGLLEPIYLLVLAYERGDWDMVSKLCYLYRMKPMDISNYFMKSLDLTEEFMGNL